MKPKVICLYESKRKPESPTKLARFLIITRGNDNRMRIHKHMNEKLKKPETLLSRVRFSLTTAPVFQTILLKKIKANFLQKAKHYPIAAEVRKSNFPYLSSLHNCPRRCLYCLALLFFANSSAEISLRAELSSLGLNGNRTFFNEQFRLHPIDR